MPCVALRTQVFLIIAIAVAYSFVYLPMLKRMNDALLRSKWLLSLFPDEVLFVLDGVCNAMASYTKSSN